VPNVRPPWATLGYEVFAGNTHDSRTLQTIVATMEARHGMLGCRQHGVAAPDRPALHHRRTCMGALRQGQLVSSGVIVTPTRGRWAEAHRDWCGACRRALPEQLGRPETRLADNGYFSEANVMACTAANIEPLIATGQQPHHPSWRERFTAPPPAPENPTPVEAMAWRLRTPQGKQLYALRKQTPRGDPRVVR
jgi:hypothetical protein